ncbi:MAG: twin-arginine translocation signal domain-containing protein, partial [Acidobacteria bacterium]|nr:twin-arginine translocation signal domain-containing protein [Acidobacteriota bacterium]
MSKLSRLDRRAFLRSTGMTAVAGAVGATVPLAAETGGGARLQGGRYDFDTIYSRIGTDSSKWDPQIARYGRDKIEVGMGTADQDFRIAPPITRALRERIGHENYGSLSIPASYKESIVDWNRRRYGLEIDPDTIQHAAGVH